MGVKVRWSVVLDLEQLDGLMTVGMTVSTAMSE